MKTILVVDDFSSVRLFHAALMKQEGYECAMAASGEEAWAELQKKPIDAVILDLVMPGMGGREFLRRLRAERRFASLRVIVITSESATVFADDPSTLVLVKPVLPNQLVEAVRGVPGQKGGTR